MTANALVKQFYDVVNNPGNAPREWQKQQGGRVIGWLKTDVPEELIHAAGFLPYGIVGGKTKFSRVDAHLQSWACSLMRSCLGIALNDELNFLDGLIIPHTCDTTRMVSGIWRQIHLLPYMENFFLPRQVDRASSKMFMLAELMRLKESLEVYSGSAITEENLRNSIALYNENRGLMRLLFAMHEKTPGLISCRDLYTVVRASMMMPKETHSHLLEQLLQALRIQNNVYQGRDKVRVIISGPVWEPPELMDIIDSKGTVVGDDLLTGFRYIASDVNTEEEPLAALAERQLNRIPFACFDSTQNPRRQFLVNLVRQKQAKGVIFLHLKFCEPENYDYYDHKLALEKAGIPSTRIETEVGGVSVEQMRTRIEAFFEMLGGI